MNFKINTKKIMFFLGMCLLVAFGWRFLVNTGKLCSFFYIDSSKIDISNLMFYTWQVQVTIALISISLTSLIVGNLERKIFGQNIKEILMITTKFQLTYIDKIILVILLSVINFWFIIYNNLPGLIVMFIFSIIGVLDLIIDSYSIVFNPEKYEYRVRNYVDLNLQKALKGKVNVLDELINNLEVNNKALIKNNNVKLLQKNIDFLFEIIIKINNNVVDKNNNIVNNLIDSYEKSMVDTGINLVENNYIESVIYIINIIKDDKFKCRNKKNLIGQLVNILFDKIKEVCSIEIYIKIIDYFIEVIQDINNKDEKTKEVDYIINGINKSIVIVAKYLVANNYIDTLIQFINRIRNDEFNYTDKKYLIEELLEVLIHKTKEVCSDDIYDKIIKFILDDIFDDVDFNYIDKSFLSRCQFDCFYWIYRNDKLSSFSRKEHMEKYISLLIPSEFGQLDLDKYYVEKLSIYFISHKLIINNDIETFGKIYKELYERNAFSLNLDNENISYEIVITINIFIYYILFKENACEESFREKVKKFLFYKADNETKYTLNIKDFVINIGKNIWDSYRNIKDEMPMNGWEYCPRGSAKQLIIKDAIDEYFMFYSIANINDYMYTDLISSNFDRQLCFKTIQCFNEEGILNSSVLKDFKEFINIYFDSNDDEKINRKMKNFYYTINKLYVKLLIEQEETEYCKTDILNESIKKLKCNITDRIKNSSEYIYTSIDSNDVENITYKSELETSVLTQRSPLMGKTYEDYIIEDIWNGILKIVGSVGYKYNVYNKNKNKISKLFKLIKEKEIEIKSIVNNSMKDNFFINYNEDDNDKNSLNKFQDNLNKIFVSKRGKDDTLLLHEDELKIRIEISGINVAQMSDDDIEEYISNYKVGENKYRVNVVNHIKLIFTKDEIKKYFVYKYKMITIKYKINHNIKENEVIAIEYNMNL